MKLSSWNIVELLSISNEGNGQSSDSRVMAREADLRDRDIFLTLQSEMEKLTGIYDQNLVDWSQVEALALRVLREEGKDLSVVVWLVSAGFKRYGVAGLIEGLSLLAQMLTLHWGVLTPPLTRLRARRNQIQWLIDWLGGALASDVEITAPQASEQLQAHWQLIADLWKGEDEQAPDFNSVARAFKALSCKPPLDALPVPEDAKPVMPVSAAPHEVLTKPALSVLDGLRALINQCLQEELSSCLLYRLNRLQAWSSLDECPSAQQGITRVPAPTLTVVDSFRRVQEGGDQNAIVRFCESRLCSHPLWLDLNRASHGALLALGAAEAAAAVQMDTAVLLQRLPALAELNFADGQPFSDALTQQWLSGMAPARKPRQANTTALDESVLITEAVLSQAASGQLDKTLFDLQEHVRRASSGRERFRVRLAQCDLLQRFGAGEGARALLASLLDEMQAQRLELWEPSLAQPLLVLAASQPHDEARQWLPRLAALDGHAAWLLASRSSG